MRSAVAVLGLVGLVACSRTAFVHTEPAPPVAIITPATSSVLVGQTAVFSGSASRDPLGDPLTYAWRISGRPALGNGVLEPLSAQQTRLRTDRLGAWEVALIVTAGGRVSEETRATVVVESAVESPHANAGPDQRGTPRDSYYLDGSLSSDPGGEPLSFSWAVTDRPMGSLPVLLPGATPATRLLRVDRVGRYEVMLTATAGARSGTDVATITVSSNNNPPIANAGLLRSYTVGSTAVLDGRASRDPDGDPLTFAWRLLSGPAPVVLSDASSWTPDFPAAVTGDYRFELTVTDWEGAADLDDTTVRVLPRPDAGVSFDGGCDVFAAGEVYIAGTVEVPYCGRGAMAHWSTPNTASLGFECNFTAVHAAFRPSDGRLLYKNSGESVLREFRCDSRTGDGGYPTQVTANDPVVPTPCPAGQEVLQFLVSPQGTVWHTCNFSHTALRDATGAIQEDVSPNVPVALGVDGWVLTLGSIGRFGVHSPITNLPWGDWLATRWKEPEGFWVVVQGQTPNHELWLVEKSGAALRVGSYPPLPVSVSGTMDTRLDAAGRIFEIGMLYSSSTDVIVRRELGGTADVVYSEATNPLVQLHISHLLTGP